MTEETFLIYQTVKIWYGIRNQYLFLLGHVYFASQRLKSKIILKNLKYMPKVFRFFNYYRKCSKIKMKINENKRKMNEPQYWDSVTSSSTSKWSLLYLLTRRLRGSDVLTRERIVPARVEAIWVIAWLEDLKFLASKHRLSSMFGYFL